MYAVSPPSFNRRDLAIVVVLHGAAVWGLLQVNVISLPAPLSVLTVSLLAPSEAIQPEPQIIPPRPKPVERRPTLVQQPSQLATPADSPAPTPLAVPPMPPVHASVATAPAPAPAPAPATQTQPRFDADYLDNPKPPYPALSRRMGETGRVVLRVRVDPTGQALEVQVLTSSGYARLDHSAAETVRRWKFVPARLGNDAVAATVLVPIAFSLKD